MWNLFTIKMI